MSILKFPSKVIESKKVYRIKPTRTRKTIQHITNKRKDIEETLEELKELNARMKYYIDEIEFFTPMEG